MENQAPAATGAGLAVLFTFYLIVPLLNRKFGDVAGDLLGRAKVWELFAGLKLPEFPLPPRHPLRGVPSGQKKVSSLIQSTVHGYS